MSDGYYIEDDDWDDYWDNDIESDGSIEDEDDLNDDDNPYWKDEDDEYWGEFERDYYNVSVNQRETEETIDYMEGIMPVGDRTYNRRSPYFLGSTPLEREYLMRDISESGCEYRDEILNNLLEDDEEVKVSVWREIDRFIFRVCLSAYRVMIRIFYIVDPGRFF